MKILYINTVFKKLEIGLSEDNNVLSYFEDNRNIRHSEKIINNLDIILKTNNLELKNIDVIALVIGPGAFTGIRIGLALLKSITFIFKDIKIVSLPTLELLSKTIKLPDYNLITSIPAYKNYFYISEYFIDENLEIKVLKEAQIVELDNYNFDIKKKYLIIDTSYNNKKINIDKSNVRILDYNQFNLFKNILPTIINKIKNQNFENIYSLKPLYLKKSDAEDNKK